MRAFLLAAGKGLRFRPVTDEIPKPLFPFLNVPLVRAHLSRLNASGVRQAGLNLHHLGQKIRSELEKGAADLPELRFFPEPRILGTAGALRNAEDFLSSSDFFVVNCDAALEPDFARLARVHRESRRTATLLVVENREPDRYTPLEAEGDRIVGFGGRPAQPLLYTGVCVLSPRLLARIPEGETQLVAHLWQPLLASGSKPIGWLLHDGAFSDLGVPRDFLRASLEALAGGGPFPPGSGSFEPGARVLARAPLAGAEVRSSVVGDAGIGRGARVFESVVWDGVAIGEGVRLSGCVAAGGRIPPEASYEDVLLWRGHDGTAAAYPLDPDQRVHCELPRR
jgi:mannose-1-phosphate guanylyltransferase